MSCSYRESIGGMGFVWIECESISGMSFFFYCEMYREVYSDDWCVLLHSSSVSVTLLPREY